MVIRYRNLELNTCSNCVAHVTRMVKMRLYVSIIFIVELNLPILGQQN